MSRQLSFRSPNFTAKEVERLIYNLELKPELITPASKIGTPVIPDVLSVNDRVEIWSEIANEVNLAGEGTLTGVVRTGADIRKKWNDLKSRVKIKAADIRKGKLPESQTHLSPLEERVLQLIVKTSETSGINGALPPANLHCFDRKKFDISIDYTTGSSLDSNEATNKSLDSSATPDRVEPPAVKKVKIETIGKEMILPHITEIPIFTFSQPIALKTLQPKENIESTEKVKNSGDHAKSQTKDSESNESDKTLMIEMLYESQKELTQELNGIKRILYNISQQKRKRLEQEREKIQLKKMKLLLECKKQGVDFDEFITDFL